MSQPIPFSLEEMPGGDGLGQCQNRKHHKGKWSAMRIRTVKCIISFTIGKQKEKSLSCNHFTLCPSRMRCSQSLAAENASEVTWVLRCWRMLKMYTVILCQIILYDILWWSLPDTSTAYSNYCVYVQIGCPKRRVAFQTMSCNYAYLAHVI